MLKGRPSLTRTVHNNTDAAQQNTTVDEFKVSSLRNLFHYYYFFGFIHKNYNSPLGVLFLNCDYYLYADT